MRRAVSPGSDPNASAKLRVTGNTTLPPRAVSDGTNGATTIPAATTAYPNRSGVVANRAINSYATRIPNPVELTARANRYAEKISHTVWLLNPSSTRFAGTVPVTASSVIATSTQAPIAIGCTTSARIVARNTATRCRCASLNPGHGKKYSSAPGANTITQRTSFCLKVHHHIPPGKIFPGILDSFGPLSYTCK